MSYKDFYNAVRNKGKWDFKQQGGLYENFGNYHFGVVSRAIGIPETVACRGAGAAQGVAGTSTGSDWGKWNDIYDVDSSYGDDPNDQKWIKNGVKFYNDNYFYPNIPSFNLGPAP